MAQTDARDTKDRLLDAAERLFGEQGFARVSVRDVTNAAGANVAAVNYHFGSREALVREVFQRRVGPLNDERLRLMELAEAAAGDGSPTLESVLHCFLEPTFRWSRRYPEFMMLMGRLHIEPAPITQELMATGRFPELIDRMRGLIIRALPDVPLDDCWWGVFFCVGAMIHTWSKGCEIELISDGEASYGSDEEVVDRLVRFTASGLRAFTPDAREE